MRLIKSKLGPVCFPNKPSLLGFLSPSCSLATRCTHTVSSKSIAMFSSFGLFAVWCFTVWKSHLALQRERKVLLLGFLMDFSSYNLNQWLWRYALFKMEITLQCFSSF